MRKPSTLLVHPIKIPFVYIQIQGIGPKRLHSHRKYLWQLNPDAGGGSMALPASLLRCLLPPSCNQQEQSRARGSPKWAKPFDITEYSQPTVNWQHTSILAATATSDAAAYAFQNAIPAPSNHFTQRALSMCNMACDPMQKHNRKTGMSSEHLKSLPSWHRESLQYKLMRTSRFPTA